MKKVFIKTFGCQMNVYDSDRITELFESINFEKTSEVDKAGCYFLNTCHIREKATEKVYSEIGRVKKTFKKKYKPLVIVGGCVAQAESNEMLKREPYIDMVIGPQSYHNIPDLVLKFFRKQQKFDLTEFDVIRKTWPWDMGLGVRSHTCTLHSRQHDTCQYTTRPVSRPHPQFADRPFCRQTSHNLLYRWRTLLHPRPQP